MMGSIAYLLGQKSLKNVKNYCGCSIGSVLCLLLAVGYHPLEIFYETCNFKLFDGIGDLNIKNAAKTFGLVKHKKVREKIEEMVKRKRITIPTFFDLFKEGIYFSCVATSIQDKKSVLFDYQTFPKMKCTEAVLLSSNIPFIFPPIQYDGKLYLDGAILEPFPLSRLQNKCKNLIGICASGICNNPIENIATYASEILMLSIHQKQSEETRKFSKEAKIYELIIDDISIIDPNENSDKKVLMYLEGIKQTKEQFEEIYEIDRSPKNLNFGHEQIFRCLNSFPVKILSLCPKKKISEVLEKCSPEIQNLFEIQEKKPGNHSIKLYNSMGKEMKSVLEFLFEQIPPRKRNEVLQGTDFLMEGLQKIFNSWLNPKIPKIIEIDENFFEKK